MASRVALAARLPSTSHTLQTSRPKERNNSTVEGENLRAKGGHMLPEASGGMPLLLQRPFRYPPPPPPPPGNKSPQAGK